MAFSLPADLPTNWQDNIGMIENAAFLNNVGTMGNSLKSVVNSTVTGAATAYVPTSEATTSASYVDLATTTDQVTVTISASGMALVLMQANGTNTSGYAWTAFAMSGANTMAASDAYSIYYAPHAASVMQQMGVSYLLTGLTAGSTTFKMKYKSGGGTATFFYRRIAVIPFF